MTSNDFRPSSQDDLIPKGDKGDQPIYEAGSIPFQTSIQAFDLASSASAAFSPEDLMESGAWQGRFSKAKAQLDTACLPLCDRCRSESV